MGIQWDSTAVVDFYGPTNKKRRFREPLSLRRGSAGARFLGLRVRIPPRAWVCVCVSLSNVVFCAGRGLCVEPVTRPEEKRKDIKNNERSTVEYCQ